MSTPSHQHVRELAGGQHGPAAVAGSKRALDDAAREYEQVKFALAAEARAASAPERAAAAREQIAGAADRRALDRAFSAAKQSLRR